MTNSELKDLARWAAKFLDAALIGSDSEARILYRGLIPEELRFAGDMFCYVDFFHDEMFYSPLKAPILMHLGGREMEKRGFGFENNTVWVKPSVLGYSWYFCNDNGDEVSIEDENEFIAFWSAARKAVEG